MVIERVGSYAGDPVRLLCRRRRKKKTRAAIIRIPIIEMGSAIASFVPVESPPELALGAAVELFVADVDDVVSDVVAVAVALVLVVRADVEAEVEVEADVDVIVDVSDAVKNEDRSDEACDRTVAQELSQLGTDEASAVCDAAIVIGMSQMPDESGTHDTLASALFCASSWPSKLFCV